MLSKLKYIIFAGLFTLCATVYAQEDLTVMYTGSSYGTLYAEDKAGGLVNRAKLFSSKLSSEILLLDTGNNVAGVAADPAKSSDKLDSQRTELMFKSLATLEYDVMALGRDDLQQFDILTSALSEQNIKVVAANLENELALPYKKLNKAGQSIFVTALLPKSKGLKVAHHKKLLAETLKKADISDDLIVLISALSYKESVALLDKFPQIDLLFLDKASFPFFEHKKIGDTLVLSPFALGKKLGKLDIVFENSKINKYKFEAIAVVEEHGPVDPKLDEIIPACFSADHCVKKNALVARCINPGKESECLYAQAEAPELTILSIEDCKACDNSFVLKRLERKFSELKVTTIDYREAKAEELIAKYGIRTLPAFIFSRQIEAFDAFEQGRDYFLDARDAYLMHPVYSGIFYFLDRSLEKGKLDVFVDISSKESLGILKSLSAHDDLDKIELHFVDKDKDIVVQEELMRVLAVNKLYPDKLIEYLIKRLEADIRSSYWAELLKSLGMDSEKVVALARSEEANDLLKKNMLLIKELNVGRGGVFLIDNRRIFAISEKSDVNLEDYLK